FLAGESRLNSSELELGDVAGKSLLHLQCHFGMTTLSWARRGAQVTGADFSDKAIALAQRLAQETGLPAKFVCSDLYDLPQALSGEFDIVFTSHGVLSWLPDMERWAQVVAHFLKRGGIFYIVEAHPFAFVFNDDDDVTDLTLRYPYFHTLEPGRYEFQGSYADRDADYHGVEYYWTHSMSDIVNSLIGAGLRIDSFREYSKLSWKMYPFMEADAEGWWHLPARFSELPLMFSLRATKV
ncbi:MAG TPA: class I SAM-dependent methyltransferase, partial [Anaerolineae bacterium]